MTLTLSRQEPFFDTLAALGPWGRLVGFLICVPYFVIPESSIGGGQSIGKHMLGLRVVDARGNLLSFERSFCRFTLFSLPCFLNGIQLPVTKTPWTVSILLAVAVFGVGGATLYLLIFNRITRQGPHDLAVGSYVVRAGGAGSVETRAFWKPHWFFLLSLLAILTVAGVAFSNKMEQWDRFPQLQQDVKLIEQMDNVQSASAQEPRLIRSGGEPGRRVLVIDVSRSERVWSPAEEADQVARVILNSDPKVKEYDVLSIGITRSYNIGIASGWISRRFAHSPDEWHQHIYRNSPALDPPPEHQ
jgi:uncharacterized RDD family membrane protein YckC